jgi:hypothetical protein
MIRVTIANGQPEVRKPKLICHGDELGLCVVRFSCYTGELPDSVRMTTRSNCKCADCLRHCYHVYETTECGLFGSISGIVTMGA